MRRLSEAAAAEHSLEPLDINFSFHVQAGPVIASVKLQYRDTKCMCRAHGPMEHVDVPMRHAGDGTVQTFTSIQTARQRNSQWRMDAPTT